jgi:hypothetical protein
LKSIRIALLALAAAMATIAAARLLFGPFRFGPVSVTTPLNPEGFFGVGITLLLILRATTTRPAPIGNRRTAGLLALGVVIISIVALRRGLGVYFLSDDFILVRFAREWTAAAFQYSITHGGGDGFFRPLGFVSLALDAKLGGLDPVWWHASSLALHTANAVLVLVTAKRLGASAPAAGFAGALFAVLGIHPEAVVWIAGRFDLLATFFLLSGLLLFTTAGSRITLHGAALACFALAVLSKEAAYIFPLLVAGYALWKRQPLRWTVPYLVLGAILFAYRWSLFGGIGGYIDPSTGRPLALSLGFGSTLKAVAVRLWTSLYFPLNWSRDPSLPLALLALAYMGALLWLGISTRPQPGRAVWPAAAAILISVLPVLSLLAGSPTLAGSRVLYLPSVWFAILLALALDNAAARAGYRSRYAVAAIVLLFQFAALQHNLGFWEAASARVKAACTSGVTSVPDWMDGVPALANGKQECIEMGRLTPIPGSQP